MSGTDIDILNFLNYTQNFISFVYRCCVGWLIINIIHTLYFSYLVLLCIDITKADYFESGIAYYLLIIIIISCIPEVDVYFEWNSLENLIQNCIFFFVLDTHKQLNHTYMHWQETGPSSVF